MSSEGAALLSLGTFLLGVVVGIITAIGAFRASVSVLDTKVAQLEKGQERIGGALEKLQGTILEKLTDIARAMGAARRVHDDAPSPDRGD